MTIAPTLDGDDWNGAFDRPWSIDEPTTAQLEFAINRLDAQRHTSLAVRRGGDVHLAVGGGSGRYVVYMTFDNLVFWNLVSEAPVSERVLLNVGGQEGDYPADLIVARALAVAAARSFLLDGVRDAALSWRRQS